MILEKQHRVGRLHPLPFWKGRGLGSGLRTPSSQEGDRGVEKTWLFSEEFLLIPWYLRKKIVNLQAKIKIKENVLC